MSVQPEAFYIETAGLATSGDLCYASVLHIKENTYYVTVLPPAAWNAPEQRLILPLKFVRGGNGADRIARTERAGLILTYPDPTLDWLMCYGNLCSDPTFSELTRLFDVCHVNPAEYMYADDMRPVDFMGTKGGHFTPNEMANQLELVIRFLMDTVYLPSDPVAHGGSVQNVVLLGSAAGANIVLRYLAFRNEGRYAAAAAAISNTNDALPTTNGQRDDLVCGLVLVTPVISRQVSWGEWAYLKAAHLQRSAYFEQAGLGHVTHGTAGLVISYLLQRLYNVKALELQSVETLDVYSNYLCAHQRNAFSFLESFSKRKDDKATDLFLNFKTMHKNVHGQQLRIARVSCHVGGSSMYFNETGPLLHNYYKQHMETRLLRVTSDKKASEFIPSKFANCITPGEYSEQKYHGTGTLVHEQRPRTFILALLLYLENIQALSLGHRRILSALSEQLRDE